MLYPSMLLQLLTSLHVGYSIPVHGQPIIAPPEDLEGQGSSPYVLPANPHMEFGEDRFSFWQHETMQEGLRESPSV